MFQFNALVSSFNDDLILSESSQSFDELKIAEKVSKRCYFYHDDHRRSFLEWWSKIFFVVKKETTTDFKKRRYIHWDSQKIAKVEWHFHESAIVENDQSQVICKRCDDVLRHLALDNETETMSTHLKSQKCRKTSMITDQVQMSLQEKFRKKINLKNFVEVMSKKISKIVLIYYDL